MTKPQKIEGGWKKPRIQLYLHCKTCLENNEPYSGRLSVGWTKEGIQVFCERCSKSIIDLDFKGQKLGYYQEPKKP